MQTALSAQSSTANNSLLLSAHGERQTNGVKNECADEAADVVLPFLAGAAASG